MTNIKSSLFRTPRSVAMALAIALACSASLAEKPDHGGNGHGNSHSNGNGHKDKHEQKAHKDKGNHQDAYSHRGEHRVIAQNPGREVHRGDVRVGGYFRDQQRVVVTNYYGEQFRAGRCPPGLAKKHNGCMPPGQAKKYMVGQRLPSNVVYYQVPQTVVYQLGAPPSGHRYVRVASDILLLAIGTGMVVDAIQNLGGL
ncbi:MAG: RcnB family protein [Pseudomonadota bacterium]|nr:RcnB family protein [Pseudomonadota bacterium]